MKPPICAICNERFNLQEGGLIYFDMRPSDYEWDKKREKTGKKGHPPYATWFCGKHYEKAKELEYLTIDKAMPQIKSYYQTK